MNLKSFNFQGAPVTLMDVDAILEAQWTQGGELSPQAAYRAVGIVNRCVSLRMDSAGDIPLGLYRGATELCRTDDEWDDPTGALVNPARLMRLAEGSLAIYGAAYLSKDTTSFVWPGLRHLYAPSISFQGVRGAGRNQKVYFVRRINGDDIPMTSDDLVFAWLDDPTVEFEPPHTSPVFAALASVGVVKSFDEFVARFAAAGMIKTTLLGLPRGTSKDERDRVEDVFQRFFSGVKRAFKIKVIEADSVKPVVIGSGIEDLQADTVSKNEERVATHLGLPLSLLFANAANYATATQDEKNFLAYTTVPDAHKIANTLNAQWYAPQGYRLKVLYKTMDAFQEDEEQRSAAFVNYVNGGLKQSVVAEMLGLDLPAGVEYADLDTESPEMDSKDADRREVSIIGPENPQKSLLESDIDKWERYARRRYAESHQEKALLFESDVIPASLQASIRGALSAARTPGSVADVFRSARNWAEYGF